MEILSLVLKQMLMMVTLMLAGFVLRRKKVVPDNAGIAISKLETYIFLPALTLVNQLNNCNVENFANNSVLILYGLILVLVAIGIAYPVSGLFIRKSKQSSELRYQRNIYMYALTFGNFGFMGNFIIQGIWGDAMFYKYSMLTFFFVVFSNAWGLYILIPKEENTGLLKNLKKGLTAPLIIALIIGCVCGLLNLKPYFPDFVMSALDNASKCMGPAAMILAGIIIGGYDIKKMFSNKKVYLVTFLRLIVIPAAFVTVLKLVGVSNEILILSLIAFGTPLGMNTIVYPAAYGGDTKTGASMTLVSHLLSVITIPIMYYIFVELL